MRDSESGNVFVYIFLAVALLAGLSFAVSQGGRVTSAQLTQDTRNLVATEIIGYSDTVAKAVTQLRLRGTPVNQISFANPFLSANLYDCLEPGDTCPAGKGPEDDIFNPSGGAVVYQRPPANATTTGTENWHFLANNAIEQVGTTCTATTCSDLIMAVENVNEGVCIEINDLLGVDNPDRPGAPVELLPPLDTHLVDTGGTYEPGSGFGYDETIGDEDTALTGKNEACYDGNGTRYIYYKVLIPR